VSGTSPARKIGGQTRGKRPEEKKAFFRRVVALAHRLEQGGAQDRRQDQATTTDSSIAEIMVTEN